jgi:hypothetical protein
MANVFLYYQHKTKKTATDKDRYFIRYEDISIDFDNAFVIIADINSKSILKDFTQSLYEEFKDNFSDKKIFIIITHKNNLSILKNSILDNSNIWIRTLFVDNIENLQSKIQGIKKDFTVFADLKLYEQESAQEYIDYHLRIQKENYLKGYHKQVIPNKYASEGFNRTEKKQIKKKQRSLKKSGLKDIEFRLLLVDDKIPCINNNDNLQPCNPSNCLECNTCKLHIITDLLKKDNSFHKYFPIWNTNEVKSYKINNKNDIASISKTDKVQIIGVNSIEFAKTIMADESLKFDMILLDYYFHNQDKQNEGEEQTDENKGIYGTELLQFIDKKQNEIVETGTNNVEKLRQKIRRNGGLENRFWIFPITAFPSSFQTHLHSVGVPSLTNKWYIYTPTNPIVTPMRFLHNLNEFMGMMVERSIYTAEQLIIFFKISIENFQNDDIKMKDYISSMGADYRRFLQLYGSRLNIYRDKDVSLFAKSIWEQFYSKEKNSKLITLNHRLRKFYYASAFLLQEREAYEQLRESWDKLKSHLDLVILNNNINIDDFVRKLSDFDKNISKFIGNNIRKNY